MHPQLQALEREFEGALARLRALVDLAGEEAWSRKPADGGWSAAECVAHLNLSARAMLPVLDAGLEEARSRGGSLPARIRRDLIGWLVWKAVSPETKAKSKTSAEFVPTSDLPRADVVAEFERLQGELIARVRAGDGLPIHAVKVRSVFAPVRYTIYSALKILATHEHRHLGQAERAIGG